MLKGIKFRIYPNKEQQHIIQKTFGCSRFIYNQGLFLRTNEFKKGNSIGYKETNAMLSSYKKSEEFVWLKEVDSMALCNTQMDLQSAFSKFFFQSKVGFPKYKSKKRSKNSYKTTSSKGYEVTDNCIKLYV